MPDEHVTDPDRVGALALQCALVRHAATAVRDVVVDEEPVLEVLAGVGEVEAEQLGLGARAVVVDRRADAHEVATEGDHDVPEPGVATDPEAMAGDVDGIVGPLLEADHRQLTPVADDHLEGVGVRGRADVVEDHHGRPERLDLDQRVPVGRPVGAFAAQRDDRRPAGCDLARHGEHGGALESGPGLRRDPVLRCAGAAEPCVVTTHRLDHQLGCGVDLDHDLALRSPGGVRLAVVQSAEAVQRGEPPLLLATGRDDVVGRVEGLDQRRPDVGRRARLLSCVRDSHA